MKTFIGVPAEKKLKHKYYHFAPLPAMMKNIPEKKNKMLWRCEHIANIKTT